MKPLQETLHIRVLAFRRKFHITFSNKIHVLSFSRSMASIHSYVLLFQIKNNRIILFGPNKYSEVHWNTSCTDNTMFIFNAHWRYFEKRWTHSLHFLFLFSRKNSRSMYCLLSMKSFRLKKLAQICQLNLIVVLVQNYLCVHSIFSIAFSVLRANNVQLRSQLLRKQ